MSGERSAQEVLDDHLSTSLNGRVEDDLERNDAPDVASVSNRGAKHGHDGLREMAELLQSQLPECTFACKLRLIEDGIRLLEWTGPPPDGSVHDGVESYVIREDLIRAQPTHCTLTPAG